jgi:hypothetical protein
MARWLHTRVCSTVCFWQACHSALIRHNILQLFPCMLWTQNTFPLSVCSLFRWLRSQGSSSSMQLSWFGSNKLLSMYEKLHLDASADHLADPPVFLCSNSMVVYRVADQVFNPWHSMYWCRCFFLFSYSVLPLSYNIRRLVDYFSLPKHLIFRNRGNRCQCLPFVIVCQPCTALELNLAALYSFP